MHIYVYVQPANLANLQAGQASLPIGRLVSRFAKCAEQLYRLSRNWTFLEIVPTSFISQHGYF